MESFSGIINGCTVTILMHPCMGYHQEILFMHFNYFVMMKHQTMILTESTQ